MKQIKSFTENGFSITQYNWENCNNNEPCDVEFIIGYEGTTASEWDDVVYKTSKGNYPIVVHRKDSNGVRILLFGIPNYTKKGNTFIYSENFEFQGVLYTITILQSVYKQQIDSIVSKCDEYVEYISNHDDCVRILLQKYKK